ncbi:hypothetical protein KVV02_004443 [Mortierella alpina]|uniref:Uncharacterized protein n=1 Tax=Mortierella alpina TaxID=64518 RepID=A0A9P8A4Z9_MORAP|nr:hypothetical protein KVV02_004443 [Mortierella alpina]
MSASQDTFQSSQSIEIDMPVVSSLAPPHSKHVYQKSQYYHQPPQQPRSEPRDANFSAATLSSSSPPTTNAPKTTAATAQYSAAPIVTLPPLGNPTPLGLSAFGLTAFCVGLYNLRAGGLTEDAPAGFLIATTLFYGGMGQLLAGIMEFVNGNSLGGTVFVSYGLYWSSFAALLLPSFGITPGTAVSAFTPDFMIQFGFMSLGWSVFTFLLWTLTWRSNLATSALFFLLAVTFLLETIANLALMGPGNAVQKAAGGVGVANGILAWYCAMALLSGKRGEKANSYYELPVGKFTKSSSEEKA